MGSRVLGTLLALLVCTAQESSATAAAASEAGPDVELRAPGVRAVVGTAVARLQIRGHAVALRVAALDRAPIDRHTSATPVDRGAVVEWWRSLPSGLEHGFDLAQRPAGDGELSLVLAVADARTSMLSDSAVALTIGETRIATYGQLTVRDADGSQVPAHLSASGDGIRIAIDDTHARYPIVIDPLLVATQEVELVADDAAAGGGFGVAVSISADGSRALVSAAGPCTGGCVYVFDRVGTTWTLLYRLGVEVPQANDNRGGSVALSGDGTRAIVGAHGHSAGGNMYSGVANVYRLTSAYYQEEAEIAASDAMTYSNFGSSVAIDTDGSHVIVGASGHSPSGIGNAGAAYVFARSGTTWVEQARLVASDAHSLDSFGRSVAMSRDGTRVIIGSGHASGGRMYSGAAYVFASYGGTSWAQEAELVPSDSAAGDIFGRALAMSADGATVVSSAPGRAPLGRFYAFSRSGTSWRETASLSGTSLPLPDGVALSDAGDRALAGATIFQRTATGWTAAADAVAVGVMPTGEGYGSAVALAGDGTHALFGVPQHDTADGATAGAAYVFALTPASPGGVACSSPLTCISGNCVDGVCCDTTCGGGSASDCQACISALTGVSDGTCAAVSSGHVCRAAAGPCDVAETCDGLGTACAVDLLAPTTTICHPPPTCFAAQTCTGTSSACPSAIAATGTVCRPTAGPCDVADACDGASPVCPGDIVLPAGSPCRSVMGQCDRQEVCDGVAPSCPADGFLDASVVCRPAVGPCDVPESCPGTGRACPDDVFVVAGSICDPTVTDVCDAPDRCTGSTANCPPTFATGVVCRAAMGACDVAESCSGTAPTCPPDAVQGASTVCRASTASCDPAEACDGLIAACPTDVDHCAPGADAGADASATADAGLPPPAASGCQCRIAASPLEPPPTTFGLAGLTLLGTAWHRRKRRKRTHSADTTRRPAFM